MTTKIYHYPVWLRVWHVTNAVLCLLLIISGISMQYASIDRPFIRFDLAVSMHNVSGIILTFNYLCFFAGNIITGNKKYYTIQWKGFGSTLFSQLKYYTLGIFRGEPAPFPVNEERKFNPLQKITYSAVMYVALPVIFITGWALLFPEMIVNRVFNISGILITDIFHIVAGFVVSIFLVVHVYFCTTGVRFGSIFKSMINGWSEVH
jgi:thiosulfate reductase cytochrome b subunit